MLVILWLLYGGYDIAPPDDEILGTFRETVSCCRIYVAEMKALLRPVIKTKSIFFMVLAGVCNETF